jgi:hypothetical protein
VLHYAFLTCNIIHSTILSNNVRCLEVCEHAVNCHNHGKDHNVFVLIETADAVCESHIVSFLATQFLDRSMIPGVKDGIGRLRFFCYRALSTNRYKLRAIAICTHATVT